MQSFSTNGAVQPQLKKVSRLQPSSHKQSRKRLPEKYVCPWIGHIKTTITKKTTLGTKYSTLQENSPKKPAVLPMIRKLK